MKSFKIWNFPKEETLNWFEKGLIYKIYDDLVCTRLFNLNLLSKNKDFNFSEN